VTRHRWFLLGVFLVSSSINYLDRSALAALAPLVRSELRLSNAEYGFAVTAFSIAYAAGAPAAGWFIDRLGLVRGATLLVALWSLASGAVGLTSGFGGLLFCRALLGLAEAGGIPAAGKAIHAYLKPEERALGNSLNQGAISLGLMIAPPLSTWIAAVYGWRAAFLATGALGFLWLALWRTSRPALAWDRGPAPARNPIRIPRMWGLLAANALSMVLYSLWTNWTTLFLTGPAGLSLAAAAWYAWIPPLAAALGGAVGGWLSYRWMRAGMETVAARVRVCLFASLGALLTAVVPWLAGSPAWATAGISLSLFSVAAFSVNLYSLPLDHFGGAAAAFSVSLLVSSYGAMQAIVSPLFGWAIDSWGYAPVCLLASLTPLAAYRLLR
jgi:ACS family hexuronate transporter-like MFS transporter